MASKSRAADELIDCALDSAANIDKAQGDYSKYTAAEINTINDLKEKCLETTKIEEELEYVLFANEQAFEPKYDEIFDKRKKVLEDFKKNNHGSGELLQNFWYNVLKTIFKKFISENDKKILIHLIDIRSKLYNDPYRYDIEFHFEPNEYFTNSVLTKTYFINMVPNPEDPLPYYGAEMFKCEGCDINWNNQLERDRINESPDEPTFFDFFYAAEIPEDIDDPDFDEIFDTLKKDFLLGYYFKERIIPKAFLFLPSEILDLKDSVTEAEAETEEIEESK